MLLPIHDFCADSGARQAACLMVQGTLSLGIKWPEREASHSSPYSTEVKNSWTDRAGNYLASCSEDTWFESQLGHRQFWLGSPCLYSVSPDKSRDSTSSKPMSLPSQSFPIHHSSVVPITAKYSSYWHSKNPTKWMCGAIPTVPIRLHGLVLITFITFTLWRCTYILCSLGIVC
jgi:hypothetical protein